MPPKRGGKVCWPGGGGAPAPTTMMWEDLIVGVHFASDQATWNNATWFNNPNAHLKYWEFAPALFEGVGYMHSLHTNYNGTGIEAMMHIIYDSNVQSQNQNQFMLYGIFVNNDANFNVALGASLATFNFNPTAGSQRYMHSSFQSIAPGGAWAAGRGLWIKLRREDANSDDPGLIGLRLRYQISI